MTDKTKLAAARDVISGVINKINGDTKLPSNIIGYWGDDLRKALSILDQAIGEETDAPNNRMKNMFTVLCDAGAAHRENRPLTNEEFARISAVLSAEAYLTHPPAVDWIEGLKKQHLENFEDESDQEYGEITGWNAALDAVIVLIDQASQNGEMIGFKSGVHDAVMGKEPEIIYANRVSGADALSAFETAYNRYESGYCDGSKLPEFANGRYILIMDHEAEIIRARLADQKEG